MQKIYVPPSPKNRRTQNLGGYQRDLKRADRLLRDFSKPPSPK